MTSVSTISRVEPIDFDWASGSGVAGGVRRVADAAAAADGSAPLDEAAQLALRHDGLSGSALWVAGRAGEVAGFAWLHGDALDLVVSPSSRGTGLGRALAAAAVGHVEGRVTAWSHGNHPAAAALAPSYGFERVRDLWVMRRSLTSLPALPEADDGIVVRPFRVGRDEDAWLALNAEAFAHHPEQGATTRADLDAREAEDWFDAAGFLLAWRGEELVGFHWTKVHGASGTAPAVGEVYVVGVSPRAQGSGLGGRVTLAGLHHLAGLGLPEVLLYVESDNAPAVAVYERLGFTHAAQDTHVQYARPAQ